MKADNSSLANDVRKEMKASNYRSHKNLSIGFMHLHFDGNLLLVII